jgi:hypothetical protein
MAKFQQFLEEKETAPNYDLAECCFNCKNKESKPQIAFPFECTLFDKKVRAHFVCDKFTK